MKRWKWCLWGWARAQQLQGRERYRWDGRGVIGPRTGGPLLTTMRRSCSLASAMSWFRTRPGQSRCLSLMLQEWARWLQPSCRGLPEGGSRPRSPGRRPQVEARWIICSTHGNAPYSTLTPLRLGFRLFLWSARPSRWQASPLPDTCV